MHLVTAYREMAPAQQTVWKATMGRIVRCSALLTVTKMIVQRQMGHVQNTVFMATLVTSVMRHVPTTVIRR